MKKKSESNFKELLKSGVAIDLAPEAVDLDVVNLQLMSEEGKFAGLYKPRDWISYVEFDICHSLPVIAGPAHGTGNYTGWHPASLARTHADFLHQQMNLNHLVKYHDPETITHDRIIGCIVGVSFPDEPEGGWKIAADRNSAVPIHCCAAVFKIAEGAKEMLREHTSGRKKWSVSVEMAGASLDEMGIYVPRTKQLMGFTDPELGDDIISAIKKNDDGLFCLGKTVAGDQLVMAYGGEGHRFIVQGVGFTPRPAEREARLTDVRLSEVPGSEFKAPGSSGLLKGEHGVMAVRLESAHETMAALAVAQKYKGSKLVGLTHEGVARLPGAAWHVAATFDDPVAQIRLHTGKDILKRVSELAV